MAGKSENSSASRARKLTVSECEPLPRLRQTESSVGFRTHPADVHPAFGADDSPPIWPATGSARVCEWATQSVGLRSVLTVLRSLSDAAVPPMVPLPLPAAACYTGRMIELTTAAIARGHDLDYVPARLSSVVSSGLF